MRNLFILITVMLLLVSSSAFSLKSPDELQIEAIRQLEKASQDKVEIVLAKDTGIPQFIRMRVPVSSALSAENAVYRFLEKYRAIFKMENPRRELSTKIIQTDRLGMTHVRMRQSINNIPVFGRELIAHMDRSHHIYAINGEFIPGLKVSGVKPSISSKYAINVAMTDIGPAVYRWDTTLEQMLPSGKSWRPVAELMIYDHHGQARLVWRTMIAVERPEPANWVYFVDAKTGVVLDRYNDIQNVDAIGTGHSLYRGVVSINTNDRSGRIYELIDNSRKLSTYDARNRKIILASGRLFRDTDNIWGDGTTGDSQSAAVDAHWGAAMTWDYYLTTHGRNSFDDAGAPIISTVHYGKNYVNAFWNGEQMVYGDGDGVTADPLVDLDVVSHELTHAVTEHTAGLIYMNQSGALNESVSDVFAMMIDTDDYTIGEDSWTPHILGDALRYMDDPTRGGQPDHMDDYLVTDQDNGGVHTNSGIPNFAAYLATAGGAGKYGDIVTGIGRTKVGDIWYRALSVYMTSSTDFEAARLATLAAAADLYGTAEVQTVDDAWFAVGVGTAPAAPALPALGHSLPVRKTDAITRTALGAAFPSPANPEVWLPYQLASDS